MKKFCCFLLLFVFMSPVFGAEIKPPEKFSETGKVVEVVDGDTIKVKIGDKVETIRLIGLNTPETKNPRKPVECYGKEASERAKKLLNEKTVSLERDESQQNRDKYNQLPRYAWIDGKILFNLVMIAEGYAYEYTYRDPYKYQKAFKEAQEQAEKEEKGLWHPDTCAGELKPAEDTSSEPEQEKYDCSGDKYNCSDFKTHKEAQAVFDYCYPKKGDVHKLDRDKDKIACESLP